MRNNFPLGFVLVLAWAVAAANCAGEGPQSSPSPLSPSSAASDSGSRVRTLDEPAPPSPAPAPVVDPTPVPAPLLTVTIGIVGTVGSAAFSPNPAPAEVGNLVVWTNNDAAPHRIVLGDGTVVGDVAPGASTAPVPLTAASMEYHCTIHPSMVGTLGVPAATPPPYVPPPDYGPPPGYGYGYDY